MRLAKLALVLFVIALIRALPGSACHDGSPLILDLDGNGLYASDVERGVHFDLNADGVVERTAWTLRDQQDAFLWLDLDNDGSVDDGSELFGDATRLPDGTHARNGFEALAVYDGQESGGNADGEITRADVVWSFLRLWIDTDHDGSSSLEEISTLDEWRVAVISLAYDEREELDGNGNLRRFWAKFVQESESGRRKRPRDIVDVFFLTDRSHEP